MDFGIRDWLLILGPVLIAGVLIHGYWRMRNNRSSLKMALDKSFLSKVGEKEQSDHDFSMFRAELPNGGARVRSVDPESEAEQTSLNLDVEVPVLMEPIYPDNSPEPEQPVIAESANNDDEIMRRLTNQVFR